MVQCPKCRAGKSVKAGFNNGKQRYKCKLCGYYHSTSSNKRYYSDEVKQQAIRMVADGKALAMHSMAVVFANIFANNASIASRRITTNR